MNGVMNEDETKINGQMNEDESTDERAYERRFKYNNADEWRTIDR